MYGLAASVAMAGSAAISDSISHQKSTATPAELDRTRTVDTIRPHPAIQPSQGPNASVTQVKEVPLSGIVELISR